MSRKHPQRGRRVNRIDGLSIAELMARQVAGYAPPVKESERAPRPIGSAPRSDD